MLHHLNDLFIFGSTSKLLIYKVQPSPILIEWLRNRGLGGQWDNVDDKAWGLDILA